MSFREFKIIKKGYDWYERMPFEIAVSFPSQYLNNEEYERFQAVNFEKFTTIVNGYAFTTLLEEIKDKKFFKEDESVLTNNDLEEPFTFYHYGFLDGIAELEQELSESAAISNEENLRIKIFNSVKHDFCRAEGFITSYNNLEQPILKGAQMQEYGLRIGRCYKAWSLIIANPDSFLKQFQDDPKAIDFYKVAFRYWEGNKHSGMGASLSDLIKKLREKNTDYDSEDPDYFISENAISLSHKVFNGELFEEMKLKEYKTCFDLLNPSPSFPDFIDGKITDFVYFLIKVGVNEKMALKRFNISTFSTNKYRIDNLNPRKPKIINLVQDILKKC